MLLIFSLFSNIFDSELFIRVSLYLFQNSYEIENFRLSSRELSIEFWVERFTATRGAIAYTRHITPFFMGGGVI